MIFIFLYNNLDIKDIFPKLFQALESNIDNPDRLIMHKNT